MTDVSGARNLVDMPVDKLRRYEKNARIHSDKQIEKLRQSIRKYKFCNPILIDKDGMILAGHGRFEAARLEGMKEVPCVILDHLTPEEARGYILADNRIAEDAEWDKELLKLELAELESLDFDLPDTTGFDEGELNKLLYIDVDEPDGSDETVDEDTAPALEENPVSQPGDIWLLGPHRVMCGNSTDPDQVAVLCADDEVGLLFTDPPYGVSYGGGRKRGSTKKGSRVKAHGMIEGDDKRGDDLIDLVREALRCGVAALKEEASVYVCFPWKTYTEFLTALQESGIEPEHCIVWAKNYLGLGNSVYRPQHELIFYARRGGPWNGNKAQSDLWQFKRDNTNDYVHPTQKPVRLVERAVLNSSNKGDVVLDLFGGSGTTLIACEKRNRVARLMELDPKYCDVIVRRWQQKTGGQAVHAETGKPFGR